MIIMTSNDSSLDTNYIILNLRELISLNREQISEMKAVAAQIQKDNADARAQSTKDFADFKDSINKDFFSLRENIIHEFSSLKSSIDTGLSEIHSEFAHINQRITGIEHDVAGLYNWDYWLLSIILALFALPQIISGIKSLFGVITEGISGVIALFRKRNDVHGK